MIIPFVLRQGFGRAIQREIEGVLEVVVAVKANSGPALEHVVSMSEWQQEQIQAVENWCKVPKRPQPKKSSPFGTPVHVYGKAAVAQIEADFKAVVDGSLADKTAVGLVRQFRWLFKKDMYDQSEKLLTFYAAELGKTVLPAQAITDKGAEQLDGMIVAASPAPSSASYF